MRIFRNIHMLPRSHRKHNAPLSPDTAAPQQYCTDHHGKHSTSSAAGKVMLRRRVHAPFIAAESRSKPMELLIETRYLVSTICDISAACCNAVMWFLLVTRAANRCTSSEIGCAHSCHQAKEVAHARRRIEDPRDELPGHLVRDQANLGGLDFWHVRGKVPPVDRRATGALEECADGICLRHNACVHEALGYPVPEELVVLRDVCATTRRA